jgi:F0F1-type ATP synthase assembly protein I
MSRWVTALRLTGVGFYVGICIAGGTFAGWKLAEKLNVSKPLFMIVGLFVGLIVAGYGVYQMLRPFMDNKQEKEKG